MPRPAPRSSPGDADGAPVVVVTGGSAGIGRATAVAFARRGARVAVLARGELRLKDTVREIESAGGQALAVCTDVADEGQVEAAAAHVELTFGRIDVWINNAMATIYAPFDDVTPRDFRRATEVTYFGAVWGTRAALKCMKTRGRGVIVQVGSALAYRSIPLQSPYCGAKAALRGFTDSLRSELLHDGSGVQLTMVQLSAFNKPQFDWGRTTLDRQPQPLPPIFLTARARGLPLPTLHAGRAHEVRGGWAVSRGGRQFLPPIPVLRPRRAWGERGVSMKTTASDHLLRRLREWGVRRVFGYPGDGINGLMGAFDRAGDTMEFVQARHEELAAFMACGHAKFTGKVGVCMATSGAGAIHLLNGLYDARLDHQPVVAIVGQQARAAPGGDYQQEVDLHSLFKDVAGAYVTTVHVPAQVRHAVDRALRIAQEQRTVTCIVVPHDVQELEAVPVSPREHGTVHSGIGTTSTAQVPSTEALARAAGILNAGRRVAILAGAGALHAGDELVEVAEILGAGIAKALLGKAAVPDDLRFVTGAIGLLGTQPSWDLMNRCDTLLMVGSSFPYSEYLPAEGQARGVQIDIDARQLGIRYPMELNLVGDSRETLRGLIPYLEPKSDRRWRTEIEEGVAQWWRVLEVRAMNDAYPVNPQRVFWELSPRLPDRCVVTGDSGSTAAWLARDVRLRHGMRCSLSGGLASMGSAVPYALAAKLAHSDRPVVALVGDGAMQMSGLNGLITIAHRWRDWPDPRLAVLVLNNGDLNRVTWEQRTVAGVPRFGASQALPAFPYAEYARMLGLHAVRVDEPGHLGDAWDEVLHADRPAVLEVMADPNVPPVPPHVTHKQVKAYLSALRQRDPDALRTMIATAKEWWDGMFPPKKPRR